MVSWRLEYKARIWRELIVRGNAFILKWHKMLTDNCHIINIFSAEGFLVLFIFLPLEVKANFMVYFVSDYFFCNKGDLYVEHTVHLG